MSPKMIKLQDKKIWPMRSLHYISAAAVALLTLTLPGGAQEMTLEEVISTARTGSVAALAACNYLDK